MDSATSQVLHAPLPARWGRLQRWKNTIIYFAARAAFWLAARIPFRVAWHCAGLLGHLAALVAGRERSRATAQLAAAMPELSESERRRTVRRMFVHLSRAGAELTQLPRLLDGPCPVRLPESARAVLDDALSLGKGVVAVTGHIGNWELLAQVVARAGYPVTTIAGPLYDPRLTRWVHQQRTASGLGVIWRGHTGGSRRMLRVFRNNGILALLIDQDTKVQGVFVPFFGRPAYTPSAAAALALRCGAPVVICWTHRHGRTHHFEAERLQLEPTGDREADTLSMTAAMTARLEAAIRRAPEQWVWLHARWKRQPEELAFGSDTHPASVLRPLTRPAPPDEG